MNESFIAYQQKNEQRFLNELFDLLKIPSISADKNYHQSCEDCAKAVALHLRKIEMENVKIYATQGKPIVYGEKIIDKTKPTILIYGHYDVQPVEPLSLWHTPPFEPTIKNNKIYARGAADDKGQFFMHLKAVESMIATNSLCVNIKFLIEGEEEIGSPHLENFIKENKKLLAADVVLISDTAMESFKHPSIETGLRGLTYFELELTNANTDLHSGVYGGAVGNAILLLTKMLASIHNNKNKIVIPHFYDDVITLSKQERQALNKSPFNDKQLKKQLGIKETWGEEGYTIVERVGIRPTFEINGIWGGHITEGAKTVLPSKAYAKISCRLVPNQSEKKNI